MNLCIWQVCAYLHFKISTFFEQGPIFLSFTAANKNFSVSSTGADKVYITLNLRSLFKKIRVETLFLHVSLFQSFNV